MATEANLLKDIRELFDNGFRRNEENRKNGARAIKALAGDPWPEEERAQREKYKRPCESFDEISQHVNQAINSYRQNPREVELTPKGSGANDRSAEWLNDSLREISYRSHGRAAVLTCFENMVQRGYGAFGFNIQFVSPTSFDSEIVYRRFANPDAVVWDPDFKLIDASDIQWAHIIDRMKREKFKKKWKGASAADFSLEYAELEGAEVWQGDEETVQVAEFWQIQTVMRELILYRTAEGQLEAAFKEEVPKKGVKLLDSRKVEWPKVMQYITNGVEILEEKDDWPGKYIPICLGFGKELYVTENGGAKRRYLSHIHNALGANLAYNFVRNQELEVIGMTPKTPYWVPRGTVDPDDMENINRDPRPYVEYDATTEATGDTVLPPPTRQPYEPAIAPLELAAEAMRRSTQAGIGSTPLPTDAQRLNEKSGKALRQIQGAQQLGSYHFQDNINYTLEHGGRIILDLYPHVYGNRPGRQVGTRSKDKKYSLITLNQPYEVKGKQEHYSTDFGEMEVTITTGPSYDSQREEVNDFLDTIATTEQFPLVADLVVKSKNLGPMGDKIAERLVPPQFAQQDGEEISPQAQAVIQKTKQEAAALNAYAQQKEQEVQKLEFEKQAKIIDNQFKLKLADIDRETKLAIAEITTKSQDAQFRAKLEQDLWLALHGSSHETALQAGSQTHEATESDADRAHEGELQQSQQQAATESQQAQQQHEAEQAQQAQENQGEDS
jgi:hypothetical protein